MRIGGVVCGFVMGKSQFMTARQRVRAEILYKQLIEARIALGRPVDEYIRNERWRHAVWLVTGRWPVGLPDGEAGPPPTGRVGVV